MLKLQLAQSFYHFLLISGHHADIEAKSCELLTESKADSITAARDNGPWVATVPLAEVLLGQDHLDEHPEQFADEDCKDDGSDDRQEVNEV